MDALMLSLINLDTASSSGFAEQLRKIFESAETPVQLSEVGEVRGADTIGSIAGNKVSDIILLVLPKCISNAERSFIRTCRADAGQMPIIAVIEAADAAELMELFNLGVTDFITPPLKACDLMPRLWRLSEHVQRKIALSRG